MLDFFMKEIHANYFEICLKFAPNFSDIFMTLRLQCSTVRCFDLQNNL